MRAPLPPGPTIGPVIRRIVLATLLAVPSGAVGATAWLPPAAVAPPSRGAGPPALAGNDAGRAVAAWATRDGVMATLRTPGGPWYSPVRVPGSGRGATDVMAAMTADGLAAITWVEGERVRASIRPARRRFLPAVTISPAGWLATFPRIAFGLACQPLVAWVAGDARGGSSIRAACGRGDGRFGGTVAVSPAGEPATAPAVAGGPTGVIVLWREDAGGTYRVRSATRGPIGGFSPPDTVSPPGTAVIEDPSVALAPNGTSLAGWALTRGGTVVAQAATRPVTGGWTRPDDLSRPAAQVRGTRVGMDASGNAIATWSRAGVVQVATRSARGDWSAARDLSDPSLTAGPPALAASGGGAAVITWAAATDGTAIVQGSLRPVGGDLIPPVTISDPGRPAIAPQAAIGDDGIAPVAWQWTDPAADPLFAPSGIMGATGLAGSTAPGPALVVDLRARPARVRSGQAIRISFGLSAPARVRITARRVGGTRIAGSLSLGGTDGANSIVLAGSLGGASLGRGRWVIGVTPAHGTGRSLILVVV